MKKSILASILICTASITFAQANIRQGNWLVGGQANFGYQKFHEFKTTTVGVSPDAGYFFINNLAGGLRLKFESEKTTYPGERSKLISYQGGPFLRYYFLPAVKKINVFADGSFNAGHVKEESGSTKITYRFSGIALMAGPVFFLTPATALEVGVTYESKKVEDAADRTNGVGVRVGFQIHLPGKTKK